MCVLFRYYQQQVLTVGLYCAALASLAAQTPLQIVTDSLRNGSVGLAYSQQLTVTGGTCSSTAAGTASSTIDDGALPPGLSIVSPSGAESWFIQGVPTTSGQFRFTIHLRWSHAKISPFDNACSDEAVKSLTMTVVSPLIVDRTQISTTYHMAHFPPPAEIVHVTSLGNAAVPFMAQTTINGGGSWMSVTPQSGVTPALLSIAFTITGLQPGVYTGQVTLAADTNNPVVIGVTLAVVTDANLVLQASPAALSFTYTTGGSIPPAQSLAVTSGGGDGVIFQADVAAPPNGKWLSISPTGAATPAKLTVSVDPKSLAPGAYNGLITLRVAGVPNGSQMVTVTFTVQTPPLLPAINQNGVVNGASLSGAISPGAWVTIFGSNLSSITRQWRDADFVNGKLPTMLDGVSVNIDGKPAAVYYVSPTQVNVLAPDDTTTGLVFVQVKTPTGTGDNGLVLEQTAAPALFQFRTGATVYAAGTHADGSYVAGARLVQQGIPGTPAKPGETIVVYGTGFGATQPAISATALVPSPLPLANLQDLRVRIGGVDAAIAFAGLISPGVYQFNVVVPQLADGDQTIVAELRGLLTRPDLLLSVQQ